jgi:hypothetical protein
VTWSLIANPSGMSINSSTGVVSWGSAIYSSSPHTITIQATNSAGFDDGSWLLTVTGSQYGINSNNITIIDATGCETVHDQINTQDGPWAYRSIAINGAPSGAVVTSVDVYFKAIHTYAADLDVDIYKDGSVYYHLWLQEGGDSDDPFRTRNGVDVFNGYSVNGTWNLRVKDRCPGDTGYLEEWWITIHY